MPHGKLCYSEFPFRISTNLKDIIGRDLVTNEFVAVFELVKNSIDAHATRVDIGFDLDNKRIWIADNGKGMDADTIRNRWLFVAYSAKADGTEDADRPADYRQRIRPRGQYAGSKGIGRFSCDTLGASLTLYSRTSASASTQELSVQWGRFEKNSREFFQDVDVNFREVEGFPKEMPVPLPADSGTVLRIDDLRVRGGWDSERISRLRQYLNKLIDPFGTTENILIHISVVARDLDEKEQEKLEAPLKNDIDDVLMEKTTRILVDIKGDDIHTRLVDRGREIYHIREKSKYKGLAKAEVQASIFYLNRSAKNTFKRRMGVRSVEFGSVFLFLNGFRVFPIGEEMDDTLGINRRKQQGTSRYLGTRDILGRVDVNAPARVFREASSRDAGLIDDANVRDLYHAVMHKAIIRLERYVVGVNWQDKDDQLREDASGLSISSTRERAVKIIGQLASVKDLELEYFDPGLVEDFEKDAGSLERMMSSLTSMAERQGDTRLVRRIQEASARLAEVKKSEKEASEVARKAMADRARADARIERLEKQATYLTSTQDMTAEQMTLLLHQALIYSGHIGAAVDRALGNAAAVSGAATDIESGCEGEDLADAAAAIRFRNRQLADDLEYIHLENDRLIAVARFASNARFELETDQINGDVVAFLNEYITEVRANRDGVRTIAFEPNGLSHVTQFRPVDLVVLIDNLADNARKHGAQKVLMSARRRTYGKEVDVLVTDDGRGMDEERVDPARIFDKGYSSTPGGTGLGLYHARKIMEEMRGGLCLDPEREAGRASFVITLPRTTH